MKISLELTSTICNMATTIVSTLCYVWGAYFHYLQHGYYHCESIVLYMACALCLC